MFWPIQGDPRLVAMPDAASRNNSDKSSHNVLWWFSWLNLEGRKAGTPRDPWFRWTHQDWENYLEHYCCWIICFDEMLWNLSDVKRTHQRHGWAFEWDSHENWCQQSCDYCQHYSCSWTTRNHSHGSNACSGSSADLSHIRTQWCLADCLTKKSANLRSGILKEVDLILHWDLYWNTRLTSGHGCPQLAVMLISDMMFSCWVTPWRILGYFWICACLSQDIEARGLYCFSTTMAGSKRWTRSSGSTAQASAGPINVPGDDRDESEDSRTPTQKYAARRSRDIPSNDLRTPGTLLGEGHMAFCNGFR